MRKIVSVIFALFVGVATADSTITSKQYVDAALDTLQPQVPAKNTDTVLTHTGAAGEIGEKKIYNTNNSYGEQTDALVTAETFNTALQNALESEFVCTEWQDDVHETRIVCYTRSAARRRGKSCPMGSRNWNIYKLLERNGLIQSYQHKIIWILK